MYLHKASSAHLFLCVTKLHLVTPNETMLLTIELRLQLDQQVRGGFRNIISVAIYFKIRLQCSRRRWPECSEAAAAVNRFLTARDGCAVVPRAAEKKYAPSTSFWTL